MSSIVLYTSDYFCKDIKRRREIRSVIQSNLLVSCIKKIVILWENYELLTDTEKKEYEYLDHSKIDVVNWKKRQTYDDFYKHSKEHYPNDIILVSNSDILFDKTLSRVHELNFNPKQWYVLTRWERISKEDKSIYSPPFQSRPDMNWSYDCYLFKHPCQLNTETIHIEVGVGGCDTYLVKKLIVDNRIKVDNPMLDIRCWHVDYRQEENVEKDYVLKENYNRRDDYPGGNRTFGSTVTPFGGQIGIHMKTTDSMQYTQNRFVIRKGLKVISFSLWGNNDKYTKGAIKNAELALDLYPDWRCWFYVHEPSVPQSIIDELKMYPNVDIILRQSLVLAMSMRFTAIDHKSVDIMICRDTDSQLSMREVYAVNDWLQSGKTLHIMRDHPHHCSIDGHKIMGGMWGMKKCNYFDGWGVTLPKYGRFEGKWGLDQDILTDVIYPLCSKYSDICIHASFNRFESYATDFPTPFNTEYNFVGEYMDYLGNRQMQYVDMIINS